MAECSVANIELDDSVSVIEIIPDNSSNIIDIGDNITIISIDPCTPRDTTPPSNNPPKGTGDPNLDAILAGIDASIAELKAVDFGMGRITGLNDALGQIETDVDANHKAALAAVAAVQGTVDLNANAVATASTKAQNAFDEVAAQGTTILGLMDEVAGNTASLQEIVLARATDQEAISGRIDTLATQVSDAAAQVVQEAVSRSTQDSALASVQTLLSAQLGDTNSTIQSLAVTTTDANSTTSAKVDTLRSDMNGATSTLQHSIDTVSSAQLSTAADLLSLHSVVGQNTADIQNDYTTLVNSDSAIAGSIQSYKASFDGQIASANSNIATVSTNLSAVSTRIGSLSATVTNGDQTNASAIYNEQVARVSAVSAVTTTVNQLSAAVTLGDSNNASLIAASIKTEQDARASADGSLAGRIDTIKASVDQNTAAITTNATTAADANSATAATLSQLNSSFIGYKTSNDATIATNAKTASDATKSVADSVTQFRSDYAANNSSIQNQFTTLTNTQGSQAGSISSLQANATTEKQARIDGDNAAQSNLSAAVTTINNAIASGDQANATSVTQVSSRVDANTANISQALSSINGLSAQYVLAVSTGAGNTGGLTLSGVKQANGSQITTLTIDANVIINGTLVRPGSLSGSALDDPSYGNLNSMRFQKYFSGQQSTTWTVPAGCYWVLGETWGGGSAANSNTWRPGHGGGYAAQSFQVTPGDVLTIVVGAGGAPQNGSGTASSIARAAGTMLVQASGATTSGPGSGVVGQFQQSGGYGMPGNYSSGYGYGNAPVNYAQPGGGTWMSPASFRGQGTDAPGNGGGININGTSFAGAAGMIRLNY